MDQEENPKNIDADEINLMDYAVVILKRKWLVFGIFLMFVIAAGVFSYFTPKIYEIDTSLEIGKIGKAIIEKPMQVVEKIENNVYESSVREKLGIEGGYSKIKAEYIKNTDLVKIKIESENPELSKSILEEMNNLILAEHQEKIKTQKELIESNIETTQDKIQLVESDIEKTKNKIKPLENDIERIENKIEYSEEEKENLEAKVDALEKVLVYEQTPGTQFALFDTKEKLASKKQEVENLYSRINSLTIGIEDLNLTVNSSEASIGDLNAQTNSLRASLSSIKNTEVIKKPIIPDGPIKSRFLLNVVIAGVLGLSMGVFLAFGKEWWQRSKTR